LATVTKAMTVMAANLTKDWIQYLKNNQIAALQSDPKSGKLNYRRPVLTSDVVNFLQVKTDYDDDKINSAIEKVLGQGTSGEVAVQSATKPQDAAPGQPPQPAQPATKKYDTSGATDVTPRYGKQPAISPPAPPEPAQPTQPTQPTRSGGKIKGQVSQSPGAIRKRQARANRKAALREDFKDEPGEQLSEKQVGMIFNLLGSETDQPKAEQSARVDPQQVRIEEVNKLKRFIRDTLSEQQRMSLWRALQNA
jgi:hypothetical protein